MPDTNIQESSAHPNTPNFDPAFAQEITGDLAEEVRKHFSDKHGARPPGLQTQVGQDGSITIVADNPEVGIGVQVVISLIGQPQMGVGPDPMMQPQMGMGPQQPQNAPIPPANEPVAPQPGF